jgi:hypothetical protein
MAGSSSRDGPFLTYLTVFQSRLGLANLVLSESGHAFLPEPTLQKNLRRLLSEQVDLDPRVDEQRPIIDYLTSKKLIGSKPREKGRYGSWTLSRTLDGPVPYLRGQQRDLLPVFRTDVWFADPRLRSTVGVPTADNAAEVLALGHQLRLLTRSKNTWTAAGQTVAALRTRSLEVFGNTDNPFVLQLETVALMRQVISQDWLLLSEILPSILAKGEVIFGRDDIAADLPECATRAYKRAKALGFSPSAVSEAREFAALLHKTQAKAAQASSGPGVLQHRTAPRLEWLTDCGALSKEALPKNGFQYRKTADLQLLNSLLQSHTPSDTAAETVAIQYWRECESLADLRRNMTSDLDWQNAIIDAFRRIRRSVGPASLREISFVALACHPTSMRNMDDALQHILQWAASEKGVTLSGGRFSRSPEFVHLSQSVTGERA